MSEISGVKLESGGVIFFETEDVAIPDEMLPAKPSLTSTDGYEKIGTKKNVKDVLELLKETIVPISEAINAGFKQTQPDEWGIELNIGFKGKAQLIPVVLSGESNVAIKVKATWRKSGGELV